MKDNNNNNNDNNNDNDNDNNNNNNHCLHVCELYSKKFQQYLPHARSMEYQQILLFANGRSFTKR